MSLSTRHQALAARRRRRAAHKFPPDSPTPTRGVHAGLLCEGLLYHIGGFTRSGARRTAQPLVLGLPLESEDVLKMSETQEVVAVEPVEPARSLLRNTSKSTTHIPGVSLKTCIVLNNNCSLLRNFQTRPPGVAPLAAAAQFSTRKLSDYLFMLQTSPTIPGS
ncbi:hypothetical protein J6590_108036 [Homalodisca vitripennis]|nr:hypothetical protein J6590_108036 [Homalodisca vitripennis]